MVSWRKALLLMLTLTLSAICWLVPPANAEEEIPEPDLVLPEGYTITGEVTWENMVVLVQKNLTIGPTGHLRLVNSTLIIDISQIGGHGLIVIYGRAELLNSEVECVSSCAVVEFEIHLKPGARLLAEETRLYRCYLYGEWTSAEIYAPSARDGFFFDITIKDTNLTLVNCRALRFTAWRSNVMLKGCEFRRELAAHSSNIVMESSSSFRSDSWGIFLNSSTLVMRGCEVVGAYWDGIVCYRSKAFIYNSTIRDNAYRYYCLLTHPHDYPYYHFYKRVTRFWRSAGIACIDSELVVQGCWLFSNPYAIVCDGPLTKAEIHWSGILGGRQGSLKGNYSLTQPMNATLNWWGRPKGPFEGDVTGRVLIWPWLVGPPPDRDPPRIEITRPSEGDILEGRDIVIEWTVSDDVAGVRKVELILDGGEPINVTGHTNYTLEDIPYGRHTLVLRAVDWAGRVAETSRSFEIRSSTEVLSPAGISISAGLATSGLVATASLLWLRKKRY